MFNASEESPIYDVQPQERLSVTDRLAGLPWSNLRHSPAALVVEEEDEEELLFGFVLHLLPDAEHVHRRHGDGHAVVLAAHPRHVRVDDLHTAGEG